MIFTPYLKITSKKYKFVKISQFLVFLKIFWCQIRCFERYPPCRRRRLGWAGLLVLGDDMDDCEYIVIPLENELIKVK